MSISLTLTHASGTARFTAEPRSADAPVLVGRGAACDVVVPDPDVSTRHAALFVHRGRWAVQDLRSRGGTALNGEPIDRPRHLRASDHLALGAGASPPALYITAIDEEAADRWVPPDAAPVPLDTPVSEPAAVEWMAAELVAATTPHPRRRGAWWPTVAGLLIATATVAGAAWYTRDAGRRRPTPPTPRPPIASADKPPPIDPAALAPAPTDGEGPTPETDVPTPRDATPSDDPAREDTAEPEPPADDPAWSRVLEADRMSPPRVALYLLIEYEASHPDAKPPDVGAVQSAALDRLWWGRVTDLVAERDAGRRDVADAEAEIVRTPLSELDARADAIAVRDAARERVARADAALVNDYAYDAPDPPPDDGPALDALRAARDPARFADWSESVVDALGRTNGDRLPWQ